MDIDKPAFTTEEIEKIRAKLENIISVYGLDNRLTLEMSAYLDKIIADEIKKNIR